MFPTSSDKIAVVVLHIPDSYIVAYRVNSIVW